MYVDPSRVEMALRYAALAIRPPAERAAKNVEVTLFIASLWADATNAARTRYKAAAALQGSLPWSALTKPTPVAAAMQAGGKVGSGLPTLQGPAVALLLLGQKDPEDEGVEGYRLIMGEPRATAIIQALYAWDVPLLSRTADPSGWRLDAADEPAEQPTDDAADDDAAEADDDVPENDPEGAAKVPAVKPTSSLSSRQQGLAAAGVAAGFTVVGLIAWRFG